MAFDDLKRHLQGVAAVPTSPFRASDEEIDEAAFREQIGFLRDSGVDTLVPCGNTMEFYSLTLSEVERLNAITFELVQDQLPIIVGVGYDTRTAITLAKSAEDRGADAVMIHQPSQPFLTSSGITSYIAEISEAIDIGVILYVRRELLGVAEYRKLFELENVIGVKHATNDLQFLAQLIANTREYDVAWICGSAEGWAPFYHVAGARGFTSGLANVFPRHTLAMRDALHNNDLKSAMGVWHQIEAFESMRAKEGGAYNVAVVKEALNLLGRQGGVVRKPASGLTAKDRRALEKLFESWGIEVHTHARAESDHQ